MTERLSLNADELAALSRQGFVSPESRGDRLTVFKLRFRLAGRQQVRWLGSDPHRAEAIRQALAAWQKPHAAARKARALARQAAAALRDAKHQLLPHARRAGYTFHGLALRRRRATGDPTRGG